jgi:hypothetical protein
LQKIKTAFMQLVKYLCCLAILFASCRSVRQTTVLPTDVNHIPIAYAVSPKSLPNEAVVPEPTTEVAEIAATENIETREKTVHKKSATPAKINMSKVQSFSQLKQTIAASDVKMSKKDIKMLNKLEKKYKGNFDQFKADT